MKIYVPFKVQSIGGASTFAEKFKSVMQARHHEVTFDRCADYDILFSIADAPPIRILWEAKRSRKPIIQRLDGVYHRATTMGRLFPLRNLKMQVIHNFLADAVVYQSEFSRISCERFLGKTCAQRTAIIYNGVEVPALERNTELQAKTGITRLVTFSKFRRRDQIKPLVESVGLLDPKKYVFDIYGSYTGDLRDIFSKLGSSANIRFRGKLPNSELLQKIAEYDLFLFSDQSACPNSVLEALAAGLPVVGFNRGSMNEIIEDRYNGLLAPVRSGSHPFASPYPFTETEYRNLALLIEQAAHSLDVYSRNARQSAKERFSIDRMAEQYEKMLLTKDYEK